MKILAIISSGRKKGNTSSIVSLLDEQLQEVAGEKSSELEFETVFLSDYSLQPCIGCRVCFDQNVTKCPLHDGLLELRQKVQEADLLILASPVYVEDVSGMMKTFIDRMSYACHRPEFGEKLGFAIMTYGSRATTHTLRTMTLALSTWGFHVVGQQGFYGGSLRTKEQLLELNTARIKKTAEKIKKSLKQKAYLKPDFVSLMMFSIQQETWRMITKRSVDQDYWLEQGWLKPGVTFYYPHEAGGLKTRVAHITGKVLSRFMN